MAVRNFYLNASIDGRKTRLTGGPSRKDGGFDLTITQRHAGEVREACTILARAAAEGKDAGGSLGYQPLTLTIRPSGDLETKVDPDGTITITSRR
jgi:hypothetical protein